MRRVIVFYSLICLFNSCIDATDVKVGVFIHAPLVQQVTNTSPPTGPTIDYITAMIREMGFSPVISVLPYQRVMSGLKSGEIDMTLEIGKLAERETFLYFSDKPVHHMKPSLTFLASNELTTIHSIDDLRGMKIGYLVSAFKANFFDNAPSDIIFDLINSDTWVRQNLEKLLAGRIDAAFDQNAVSYLDEAKKLGVAHKIKTISLPGEGTEGYVVFSKKSTNGKILLDAFNKVAATGKYDENKMIDDYMNR